MGPRPKLSLWAGVFHSELEDSFGLSTTDSHCSLAAQYLDSARTGNLKPHQDLDKPTVDALARSRD